MFCQSWRNGVTHGRFLSGLSGRVRNTRYYTHLCGTAETPGAAFLRHKILCSIAFCGGGYKSTTRLLEIVVIKVGIVGGTGYTGVELLRILVHHPETELKDYIAQ